MGCHGNIVATCGKNHHKWGFRQASIVLVFDGICYQWPSKLEVPTIYKASVREYDVDPVVTWEADARHHP